MHKGSKFPDHGSNLLALEEWSLNHWTTREVPRSLVKISLKMDMKVYKKKKKGTKIMRLFHGKALIKLAIPFQVQMSTTLAHTFWDAWTFEIPGFLRFFKVLASQSKIKEKNWFNTIEKTNRFKLELQSSIFNGEGLTAKVWFCSQAGHTIKPTSFVTSYN